MLSRKDGAMGVAWDGTPSYLRLGTDELAARAQQALALLGHERCGVCPRLCKVDRLADHKGLCAIGRQAVVASYFPHFGEENCLRGWNGSGTIFFSGCNLRCVFCQNHDISWEVQGERVTPARLAEMMLTLQARGCHNINWVTPEHVVPQILEAVPLAVAGGLGLPIVYNTSAYDSLDSLQLMEGVVDVYMPDFKVWSQQAARRYLRRPDYAEVARAAVKEMGRQVGPLVFDPDGLARRGLLVRHLVMPGMLAETEAVLRFVAEELGPDTYVDLMAQYYPAGLVGRDGRDGYSEIDRHLYREEYLEAVDVGHGLGLRLDVRSVASAVRLAPTGSAS
jgi:putative pyruvate formate lyase activating enzyme